MGTAIPKSSQELLRAIAFQSIEHGLQHGAPFPVNLEDLSDELCELRASFVTLMLHGELRGCVGTLEARDPLAQDVSNHAYQSAFYDSRFQGLTKQEFPEIEISISVLNPSEPIDADSEEALLQALRPGIDGLILVKGHHRGTFLPSVWDSLPEPRDFLIHLKRKAGLPDNYWSPKLQFARYTVESISHAPRPDREVLEVAKGKQT